MKKDNTITVFYDAVTRKDTYRLNGIDVTDTIEMLKDKWERQILYTRCRLFQLDMSIQQRLQDQLALTEKALELACLSLRGKCDYCKYKDDEICPPDHHCSKNVMGYFLEQAEDMIDGKS